MGGFTIDGCGATDQFYAIKELGVFTCPYCHKEVRFTLDEVKRKVDIFFIPTATLSAKNAMIAIRSLFPQKSMITFATPSIGTVEKLLTKFEDCSNEDFNNKVDKILNSI